MGKRAVEILERGCIGFSAVLNYIAAALFGVMVVFVAADVIGRYFLSSPIKGDYEFVEVMTGLVISLSLAYALVVDQHVRINILTSRLSPRAQLFSDILTYFAGLLIFIVASWQTFIYAGSLRKTGLLIGVLPIPEWPFVYVVAVGFISLTLVFLIRFIHSLATGGKT